MQFIRSSASKGRLEAFDPVLKSDLDQQVLNDMRSLAVGWRRVETIILGINSDLLAYRIAETLPDAFSFRPENASLSERDVEQWLSAMLASLRQQSITLWEPLAHEAISQYRYHDGPDERAKAFWMEYEFRFVGMLRGSPVDLSFKRSPLDGNRDMLWLSCSPEDADSLLRQPTIAFAVAAFLLGQRGLWKDAENFARLCVKLAELEDPPRANLAESERLAAVITLASSTASH